MNDQLREINELYLKIQDNYFDMPPEKWHNPTQLEQAELLNHQDEYSNIYDLAIKKFNEVATSLSPTEIIEGHQQGCKLLQRNLSGHMCMHFDKAYISTMVESIKNNEFHTSYMFLQELANQLGKEITPTVIEALNSESKLVRETALSVADQLNLIELTSKIKLMEDDTEAEVAYLAKTIIASWEKGTDS